MLVEPHYFNISCSNLTDQFIAQADKIAFSPLFLFNVYFVFFIASFKIFFLQIFLLIFFVWKSMVFFLSFEAIFKLTNGREN